MKKKRSVFLDLDVENLLPSVESTRGADPMRLDESSTVVAAGEVLFGKMEMRSSKTFACLGCSSCRNCHTYIPLFVKTVLQSILKTLNCKKDYKYPVLLSQTLVKIPHG